MKLKKKVRKDPQVKNEKETEQSKPDINESKKEDTFRYCKQG